MVKFYPSLIADLAALQTARSVPRTDVGLQDCGVLSLSYVVQNDNSPQLYAHFFNFAELGFWDMNTKAWILKVI